MEHDMRANSAAFEQTVRSTIALAETFGTDDWDRPTDLPGWNVKDVLSHLAGVEAMLLGDPVPDHELPDEIPHVRNDFGRLMEVGVDVRRPRPGPEVVAELREVLDRRLAALPDIDPEQQVMCPDGKPGPYSRLMMFRAFDCWAHEQDIRRAVRRPGNLDAPAAACAWHILGGSLPYVVGKRAAAQPGQSVTLEIIGPPSYTSRVSVSDDNRARPTLPLPESTVTLRMDWETYVRLAAGRARPEDTTVKVTGDRDLADRVLFNMAVTP